MGLFAKVAMGLGGVFGLAVVGLVGTVQMRWNRTLETPTTNITASTDPEVVERGRYLVQGPAHCAGCHGDVDQIEHYEATGEMIPLTGGFEIPIPPGKMRPPNITPCETTGIGKMSDEDLARALRYGVGHEGRILFPIMPFANLADDDLTAIISYLRTVEPHTVEREPTEFTFLGKALLTFAIPPAGPTGTPPASVTPGPTVEYGEYLANDVANCNGCHTNRDLMTGEYIGEPFGGGLELDHRGKTFVIPNITLGGDGSKTKGWNEAAFIARIRTGQPSTEGSPMPWAPFSKMSDDDLRAIYAYLETIESVDRDTGPAIKPS